jgi:hypothetical protein
VGGQLPHLFGVREVRKKTVRRQQAAHDLHRSRARRRFSRPAPTWRRRTHLE